jgi:hypothetical protein
MTNFTEKVQKESRKYLASALIESIKIACNTDMSINSIIRELKADEAYLDVFLNDFKINDMSIRLFLEFDSVVPNIPLKDVVEKLYYNDQPIIPNYLEWEIEKEKLKSEYDKYQQKEKERKEKLTFWHYLDLGDGVHHYLYDGPYNQLRKTSEDLQTFCDEITNHNIINSHKKLLELNNFLKELAFSESKDEQDEKGNWIHND